MSISLGISVEGQTEYYFVRYVLARYLYKFGIEVATPVNLAGNITFDRVEHILNIMSSEYDYVTTLYDFYGFASKSSKDTYESLIDKIRNLNSIKEKSNIIPYVQMHEFESLLYVDIELLCRYLLLDHKDVEKYKGILLEDIGGSLPEEINDHITTAPSKRLGRIFKRYKKTIYGYIIAQEIGINKMREHCPRFNSWLKQLIELV